MRILSVEDKNIAAVTIRWLSDDPTIWRLDGKTVDRLDCNFCIHLLYYTTVRTMTWHPRLRAKTVGHLEIICLSGFSFQFVEKRITMVVCHGTTMKHQLVFQ